MAYKHGVYTSEVPTSIIPAVNTTAGPAGCCWHCAGTFGNRQGAGEQARTLLQLCRSRGGYGLLQRLE